MRRDINTVLSAKTVNIVFNCVNTVSFNYICVDLGSSDAGIINLFKAWQIEHRSVS
jgi:hypothetical protein